MTELKGKKIGLFLKRNGCFVYFVKLRYYILYIITG